jgi:hypothetical protein
VGDRVTRAVGVATHPATSRREASREYGGCSGVGVVKQQRATDATVKAEALRIAEEHGAAEAAKRTGVPAATIRSWRHRSGGAGPPKSMDPRTWAERKRAGAEAAWAAAQEALAQVRSLLAAGKTADAQRAALTMAILTDKTGVLEEAARREQERQLRIAEGQAQLLVAVIRMYFEAVGLTLRPAARQTLAHLLRQAKDGAPLSPPAEAAEARAEIRRQVGSGPDVGRRCCRRGRGRAAGFRPHTRRGRKAMEAEIVTGRQHAPAVRPAGLPLSQSPTQRCNARPAPSRGVYLLHPGRLSPAQVRWQRRLPGGSQGLGNVTARADPAERSGTTLLRNGGARPGRGTPLPGT